MLDNGKDLGILKKEKTETMHQAVQKNQSKQEESAGIIDGSTLGKIEIKAKMH